MKLLWNLVMVITLLELKVMAELPEDDVSIQEELLRLEKMIRNKYRKCKRDIGVMETRLVEVEGKLEEAEETIETLKNDSESSTTAGQESSTHHVAFSASPFQDSNNKLIPFGRIFLNVGEAFSHETYQFTCPVFGIYVFQSTIVAGGSTVVPTEIVMNGKSLMTQYSAGSTGNQGFKSLVIQCNKGDKVWVQIYGDGTQGYVSKYSTFSGFLLWQM